MAREEHSESREKGFAAVSSTASKTALSALLVGGLSCVGSFAYGLGAIAQTTPEAMGNSVPSAQDLLAPVLKSQPLPPAPAPVAPPAPAAAPPVTAPVPAAPVTVSPSVAPPTTVIPEGTRVEFSGDRPAAAPLAPSVAPHPVDLSDLKADIPTANVDYGNSYIDTTDYSIGATNTPEIVITERSTGCKAVLQRGQLPDSMCGSTAGSVLATGALNPALPHGPRVTLNAQGPLPSISLPQVNSVKIGPLSIGTNGIQVTRRLSVGDYYNRTERPKALGGNNNSTLRFPLSIPAIVSSPFGWRIHPIFGTTRMHTGTDLAAPQGTPVVAAYSGRVAVSDFMGGYGLTVVIGHSEKSAETLYGHLSEIFVKAGEWVEQGDVIGRVGSTGNSTGPHLHFELRKQTKDGWAVVNAGSFLQNGLATLHQGFQLPEDFSLANAEVLQLSTGEIVKLAVPKMLQSGKYATKEDLTDTGLMSTADSLQTESTGSVPPILTDAPPYREPQDLPKIPVEPGDWVSPKEVVSENKELATSESD